MSMKTDENDTSNELDLDIHGALRREPATLRQRHDSTHTGPPGSSSLHTPARAQETSSGTDVNRNAGSAGDERSPVEGEDDNSYAVRDAPERNKRKPFKHWIEENRGSTDRYIKIVIQNYDRQLACAKQRQQNVAVELNREKRAARREEQERARAAPEHAILVEAQERLRLLCRATKYRQGDKQLQQLVGREEEIVQFWRAMRLCELRFGVKASDSKVG
jgi:hypothetical protein